MRGTAATSIRRTFTRSEVSHCRGLFRKGDLTTRCIFEAFRDVCVRPAPARSLGVETGGDSGEEWIFGREAREGQTRGLHLNPNLHFTVTVRYCQLRRCRLHFHCCFRSLCSSAFRCALTTSPVSRSFAWEAKRRIIILCIVESSAALPAFACTRPSTSSTVQSQDPSIVLVSGVNVNAAGKCFAMLNSVGPAATAASVFTSPTGGTSTSSASASAAGGTGGTSSSSNPTSSRSRLRGLSYLRSYTHTHLHRSETPPPALPPALTRSTSSPGRTSTLATPASTSEAARTNDTATASERGQVSTIQSGENGWIPRSGLSSNPSTSTSTTNHTTTAPSESASADPATVTRSSADEMTRSRTASAMPTTTHQQVDPLPAVAAMPTTSKDQLPSIRFIPHVEARSSRPSLQFAALSRTLRTPTSLVRVGRYSERDQNNTAAHGQDAASLPVGFKSKVVSRRHCEFWCTDGQWYIKDVKSSSGTFLNHVRLSSPGVESRPYPVNDGDVVQLGIDFKGGEEVIFRCVKIRVECNRGWQKSLNSFNTSAHKKLFKSAGLTKSSAKAVRDSDAMSVNSSSECSICLNPVAPCQALFVAPCSHVWHYKCVRNLIHGPNWPNFLCPNCRFVADLEADVEQPEEEESWEAAGEEDLLRAVEGSDGRNSIEQDTPERSSLAITNGSSTDEHQNGVDSPPRVRSIRHFSSDIDDELTRLLGQTHLASSREESNASLPAHTETTASRSRPIQIANRPQASSDDPIGAGARSTTPTSHTQFALSAGAPNPLVDGPMTPRNDAGPFVFDGSAGRIEPLDSSILGQPVPEVSEPGTPEDGQGPSITRSHLHENKEERA